jgi:transcriptional regulator with XRE-family HTH domain
MVKGESFGERIKNDRTERNKKQSDIAAKLGCAATSLTNYESGKIQPAHRSSVAPVRRA